MSESLGPQPSWSGGHRLAGTTTLLLGFVVGAVVALFATYYLGRDSGPRGVTANDAGSVSPVDAPKGSGDATPDGAAKPFASRMTYELSQLPEERPQPPVKPPPAVMAAPAPVAPPAAIAPAAQAASLGESAPERVANARPISATPPDPRDRTREIEKEAQKPEYRDPGRTAKAPPPVTALKVIEGREVELKPKLPDTPRRPIVAGGAIDSRAEIEAERNSRAADTQVAGVTPIARAPAVAGSRSEVAPKMIVVETKAAGSASAAATAGSSETQARLEATREWLTGSPPTTHTIQLMGTNSEEQLKAHLKSLSKVLDPAKIYIFRTIAQGKPSITVLYGSYADRGAAAQALAKLPGVVTANRPVLRTVNGIRTEMKQHKTDG